MWDFMLTCNLFSETLDVSVIKEGDICDTFVALCVHSAMMGSMEIVLCALQTPATGLGKALKV